MYDGLWLKRVLIPLWVILLILVIIEVIGTAAILGISDNAKDNIDDYNDSDQTGYTDDDLQSALKVVIAVAAVYFVLGAITIIFQIVEIVQFARKKLSPKLMVILNCITTAVWVAIFIVAIAGAAGARRSAFFGIIWPIVLVAVCIAKLIYASVIFHRFRRTRSSTRGAYTPAHPEAGGDSTAYTAYNPAAFTNPTGPPSNPFRDSRDPSPAPPPAAPAGGAADSYYAPGGQGGQYEMTHQSGGRYYNQ